MNGQELILQISRAFAHVALPQVRVAPHHCGECDDIVEALQGRNRESLSQTETGVFGNTQIHLIAPEAIHYYFPNILTKALDTSENDFLIDVLYFLSLSGEHSKDQVSLFDREQRRSVYQFLTYIQEHRQEDVENYGYGEELTEALKNWTSPGQSET